MEVGQGPNVGCSAKGKKMQHHMANLLQLMKLKQMLKKSAITYFKPI
jgi:hypothetical protein